MDRMRPVYVRQKSIDSPSGGGTQTPSSPMVSPYHRHTRSGSISNLKKPQNTAAKAAAQRMAQVMSSQSAEDDESEEEDLLYDSGGVPTISMPSLGLAGGRAARPRPASVRTSPDQPLPQRWASGGPALSPRQVEQLPPLSHSISVEQLDSILERPSSVRSGLTLRPIQSTNLEEQVQPPSARTTSAARSSQTTYNTEQPLSARSTSGGNPNMGSKLVPMMPPSVPIKLRPQPSLISVETPHDVRKDKRLSVDMKSMKLRETDSQQSVSALQDELDMLQEENESLVEKLRLAEERVEEAEARARQLEKQDKETTWKLID